MADTNGEPASKRTKIDEADDDWEEEVAPVEDTKGGGDLYLDTINRALLDFDFERVCSVSLSNLNIYACLVCGKYYQGRGKSSHAYAHSIHEDHHVFINLSSLQVYVLPDSYKVEDPSLNDIKFLLSPTFTPDTLQRLTTGLFPSQSLQKVAYKPGFVGLNNIKHNSFMNVILQALLHVAPLRDYFIYNSQPNDPADPHSSNFDKENRSELVKRFGMLCRRFWNPKNFKPQVSPHEFLQEVTNASGKKYKITEQGDPLEFLGWLLNALHRDLGGTKRQNSSIIASVFQGEVQMEDQAVVVKADAGGNSKPTFDISREVKQTRSPFLFLALDLPPTPLFQDAIEKNIIPQVSLASILAKYDGISTQEAAGRLRRFKLQRLPPFLIFSIKRFTSNNFVEEKNPTIVNFPIRNVDMKDYVDAEGGNLSTAYDLVANITHSSAAGTAHDETTWQIHVHTKDPTDSGEELWFQIQDLIVEEINKQMIFLGETYIQIWERRVPGGKHNIKVDTAAANKKRTTTKAMVAAANPLPDPSVAEKHVVAAPKGGMFGNRAMKNKRDRGDSGIDI